MDRKKKKSRREFLRGRKSKKANPASELKSLELPELTSRQRLQAEYLQHFSKRAMACDFEIFFNLNQYDSATEASLAAFQLIDELETRLSVYQTESEISRLNKSGGSAFVVSAQLRTVLQHAELIHQQTNAAFDITSTPLSKAWGFYQRRGAIPPQKEIDQALTKVDATKIQLEEEAVRLLNPELEINLNSIGKGYALDESAAVIRGFGVHDFILHGGQSSVVARGNETKSDLFAEMNPGWTVGLSHPFVPNQRLAEITLKNQSLSTSGTARQGFFYQGKRYGHIIDPKTGWPTNHFLSTTVVGESTALCDALATAFFVMTLEEVQTYCDQHPEVAAILVTREAKSGIVSLETFNTPDELLTLN